MTVLPVSAQNVIEVNDATDVAPANDGVCTLREAITAANSNTASGGAVGECAAGSVVNPDTIYFDIGGGGSSETIQPTSALPDVSSAIYIDGFSQNCGGGPCIELDGTNAGIGSNGFRVTSSGSTIR